MSQVCKVCVAMLTIPFGLAACDWGRFEELKEDSPVVRLEAPRQVTSDFGGTMAVSALNSSVQLLVGGSPRSSGAGVYELGQTEEPDAVAVDSGHCPTEGSERTCALARTPAALGRATSPSGGREQEQCFVSGSGRAGCHGAR